MCHLVDVSLVICSLPPPFTGLLGSWSCRFVVTFNRHLQSSFNSVFSSSPKVAECTSSPPRSLSLLPSISFNLQLLQSSTRLSSHSLPPASSMSFLAVLAFADHSLPSSLPSVYYHLLFQSHSNF